MSSEAPSLLQSSRDAKSSYQGEPESGQEREKPPTTWHWQQESFRLYFKELPSAGHGARTPERTSGRSRTGKPMEARGRLGVPPSTPTLGSRAVRKALLHLHGLSTPRPHSDSSAASLSTLLFGECLISSRVASIRAELPPWVVPVLSARTD